MILAVVGYIFVKAYPDFKTVRLSEGNQKPVKVALEFWGLFDNSDSWQEIIKKYERKTYNFNGQKVNVTINYTKKEFLPYREELLVAKKNNLMPSIFIINNNWLKNYVSEGWLSPLNPNKAYVEEYKFAAYEEVLNLFPTETIRDLLIDEKLYGLPTYSDSLALFYNKDLFEKEGIQKPPKTWKEFKDTARKLTMLKNDEIVQSGAAMGGGININRSSDIIALLMMQGGAKVIDQNKNIDINKEIEVRTIEGTQKRDPGIRAIVFYTEFSDPNKEVYMWNEKQSNSLESFANQKTAIMFGYSYQINYLLAMNPDLNYGISSTPQLESSTPINFGNVWTPVVSSGNNCKVEPSEFSEKVDCEKIAWSFLSFAIQKENSKIYLDSSGKAAARKDLIAEQINSNSKVGVFALQAKSAMSYNKFDDKIENVLVEMIDKINSDRSNWQNIINESVGEIEKLKVENEK